MGKRIRSQRRGKGTFKYKAPSHRYAGEVSYPDFKGTLKAEILELVNSVGHQEPLMLIKDEKGRESLLPAPLGVKEGQEITLGGNAEVETGNVIELNKVPAGTPINNIERRPGDGGKLVRSSGTSAHVIEREGSQVKVRLPSKSKVSLDGRCRVTVGEVAGGGRKEKPYLKAGSKHKAMAARGKLHPRTHGVAMNPPDHPHGKTHRRGKGGSTTVKSNAPPGQKVGKLSKKKKKS